MSLVPLFPLPNVVLFPEVPLPLHVFEPRYRALVTDALASHGTIGMALLKPGYQSEYHGRPPIFPLGCSGLIVETEKLADGRYNILLQGRERFRIVEERPGAPYRLALVEPLHDAVGDGDSLDALRLELLSALGRLADDSQLVIQGEVPTPVLVNHLCQRLELPVVEKLDLLACDTAQARGRRLLELLDFHRLERIAGRSASVN